jgi:amidophosphoribosyltransferase
MSDAIKHECGVAYIRLLKPLKYYHEKYGTATYGLNKLFLLMEKQRNRGQDGAGIASVKLGLAPGHKSLHHTRVAGKNAIDQIFQGITKKVKDIGSEYPDAFQNMDFMKANLKFAAEILLGHLRYGTQGKNDVNFCHPFVKPHMNPTRHLAMAGNFNLVNTDELFDKLSLHPDSTIRESDLGAMIETIHYYLCKADEENPDYLDIEGILKKATSNFVGGYLFCGLVGNGDSFLMRDPNGIRPCHYYQDDEIVVAASERVAIMTALNVTEEQIKKLEPGHALIIKADGQVSNTEILAPQKLTACSFERIYFSRGSDPGIYRERMELGRNLAPTVLKALDYHLKHTIVSFIPNTAEIAFYGLIKGLEDYLKDITLERILARRESITPEEMKDLINRRVRIEKIAIKDAKLRTFITEDASRNEMVQHAYDITYGTVARDVDTLVIIDDSIVRGTTLKESIIKMLDRLGPKRIIIVSSAPQIRYPDCYGIDMSRMGDFIAFRAAVELLKDTGKENLLTDTYNKCIAAATSGQLDSENLVKAIYDQFTPEDISERIARMLRSEDINARVDVIYQSLDGLHNACPNDTGDWYFTGNYPTKGGNSVANRAFINYMEQKEGRGYGFTAHHH